MRQVSELMLDSLSARLFENGNTLEVTERMSDFLVKVGYDRKMGARPMKRAIQRYIEDNISERILFGAISPGDNILVDVSEYENVDDAQIIVNNVSVEEFSEVMDKYLSSEEELMSL